jgi:hypothetical protein
MGMFGSRGGLRYMVPVKSGPEGAECKDTAPLPPQCSEPFVDLRRPNVVPDNRNEGGDPRPATRSCEEADVGRLADGNSSGCSEK